MTDNPSSTVPDFLQERLEGYDEAELREIAEYALDGTSRDGVPDQIVEALAMQDDTVTEAVGDYARLLADRRSQAAADSDGEPSSGYIDLIEAIIDHETEVLGKEQAVRLARSIDGLEVSSDGTVVSLTGDEVAVVGELVDAYVGTLGGVTEGALREIARDLGDDLELPANLR